MELMGYYIHMAVSDDVRMSAHADGRTHISMLSLLQGQNCPATSAAFPRSATIFFREKCTSLLSTQRQTKSRGPARDQHFRDPYPFRRRDLRDEPALDFLLTLLSVSYRLRAWTLAYY